MNVTGEEPAVGDPTGVAANATKTAGDIKAKLPLDDKLARTGRCERRPTVGREPGRASSPRRWADKQGGFSRLVAQEYAKANAGATVYGDIQKAFSDKKVHRLPGATSRRA